MKILTRNQSEFTEIKQELQSLELFQKPEVATLFEDGILSQIDVFEILDTTHSDSLSYLDASRWPAFSTSLKKRFGEFGYQLDAIQDGSLHYVKPARPEPEEFYLNALKQDPSLYDGLSQETKRRPSIQDWYITNILHARRPNDFF